MLGAGGCIIFGSLTPTQTRGGEKHRRRKLQEAKFRGEIVEWHLDFLNSFDHQLFDDISRLPEEGVVFWPSLKQSRFKSVGSVSHLMNRDNIKQLLIKLPAECSVLFSLNRDDRLKGFECLNGSFETD